MTKFYRATKDSFLWSKGAIIAKKDDQRGYESISDLWNVVEESDDEYISPGIVEKSPDWFERVYEVNLLSKTMYLGKEEAKKILSDQFTGKGK